MQADRKVIIDTNVLLDEPSCINEYDNILIPVGVLEEIDKYCHSSDEYKKFKARQSRNILLSSEKIEWLIEHSSSALPNGWDYTYVDNQLLCYCKDKNATLVTNDINLIVKAKALGVEYEQYKYKFDNDIYTGCQIVDMAEYELAKWYESDVKENIWNLNANEYLLIRTNGEIVDKWKYTTRGFDLVKYKDIKTKFTDKIKPRNVKQELAFDMLQDDTTYIKCLVGCFGSGKDLMMINTAISLLERNKYSKIVWIVQNQQVADTKDIGALPGNINEKLAPYSSILADKLGGQFGLDMFINSQQIEIMPLAFIRGRSFNNCILMLSEAENITKQHMQLIMSRLEENSMLFINGDFKQTDKQIFKDNSGLKALIKGLKGNKEFGYVMLDKTERSDLAQMANLLD